MVEAIAMHHHPGLSRETTFSPLTAVHVADVLVHPREAAAAPLDEPYLERLQLTSRLRVWRADLLSLSPPEP